ncbi:MAG TPA: LLM class F420-dependent oxidoreductase, partial [Candidatus Limnocylindria bacterium]|nr:LLM class F420-dependent oxidoreductase [Candidatus Limnocylindria bacterium]
TVPLNGIPLHAHDRIYREAEDLGYTDFWSAEADSDPWIPLALGAVWTQRATLGTAIVGAFTRGPAIIAMGAAAMGEAAPGRFCLGLGSGSNVTVERWNGGRFERPLTRVTEVVRAVRQALDGEQVNVQGSTLTASGFRLGRPAPYRIPIYVAALQERMLRQAVRIADGVITNWLSPADVTRVAAVVRDEAAKAGKDPAAVEIIARITVCPTPEPRAREAYRRAITAYLNVPVYRRFHEWLGRGEALRAMNERWDAGDRKGALAAVPAQAADELGVFGTPDECRARLREYVASGITVPVLNLMNLEQDPDARARESLAMLRALAP